MKKELINYGLSLSLVLVVATLILFKLDYLQAMIIVLLVCLAVLICTLAKPQLLSPFFWISKKISKVVIWLNKYIFMGLAFIVIFIPVGLFFKLIKRNSLDIFPQGKQISAWKEKESSAGSGNVEKLF